MTTIRMQAHSEASGENGQSGTVEVSGKLVFFNLTHAVHTCKFVILENTCLFI